MRKLVRDTLYPARIASEAGGAKVKKGKNFVAD
jgi:hypothetical protein